MAIQQISRPGTSTQFELAAAEAVSDWVELWGVFTATVMGVFNATVIIEVSVDGGETVIPLTQADGSTKYFTTPERIDIEETEARAVYYRFRCTAYVGGPVTCRFGR